MTGPEIVTNLVDGFDIGLKEDFIEPVGAPSDQYGPVLPTSAEVQLAITQWLAKGVAKGYILGPFTNQNNPIKNLITSPMFAVPKGTGWRPIHHLSWAASNTANAKKK